MATEIDSNGRSARALIHRARLGLSGKLLILTVIFVLLAEILIYAPSVASYHRGLLTDRLAAAQVAALVLDAAPDGMVPRELELRLLDQIGAAAVAVKTGERRRLLATDDTTLDMARRIDLRDTNWSMMAMNAFATLSGADGRMLRVIGPGMDKMDYIEIVLPERPIRNAVRAFSVNLLLLSLFISGLTAVLVYLALHWLIVRPVRRLSDNVTAFAADPEDNSRIVAPSGRGDEIGAAEIALADMERSLAKELREKKHLAALGLAVSKINHDLRNMLASAQLISDRLSQTVDPVTQRFAPRLMSALDRAIAFCQSTLAYGRISEREPEREQVDVKALAREVAEGLGLDGDHAVKITLTIPQGFALRVDREQIFRVLMNLARNSVNALTHSETQGGMLTIVARREGRDAIVEVSDDGPGVEPRIRPRLFEAFNATAKPGSIGLGLAIASELVRLHGGRIELLDAEKGAAFRITLPGA
ncbi:HAMP domain-containing sensor histidine kinase [Terrarubrum flagellatum]|uniref:sensor histidine kinase n=1 Tax=Terrirubrum flagellatum TaxID=2895980 RepID=UPI003144E622